MISFSAMPTQDASALWNGAPDAYGLKPETSISDGDGVPCRHCLQDIKKGEPYLIFAYRPFPDLQPYAETGPVFLHAKPCSRYQATEIQPPVLQASPDFILRGYGHNDRIVYGTGGVIAKEGIVARAEELLGRDDIAYVHVRSARNNCYQCRIEKA